jgi:hypothetical protein
MIASQVTPWVQHKSGWLCEGMAQRWWCGVPLARIAWTVLSRGGNFALNAKGLYMGAYVCDHCRMTWEGLYEVATPGTPHMGSAVAVRRQSQ